MRDSAWPMRTLGDVATWMSGGTPSTDNTEYWGGDVPWISAASLRDFNIEDSDRRLTTLGTANGTRLAPKGATIFVIRGMSLKSELRVGIAQRTVAFGQDCKALVPHDDVDPRYLAWAVKASAPQILTMVDEAGHGTGRLETRLVARHRIGVPPLTEQRRITEVLDAIDEKIRLCRESASKLSAQRFGMVERHLAEVAASAPARSQTRLVDVVLFPIGQVDPRTEPHRSRTLLAPDHVESGTGRILKRESAGSQGATSGKYQISAGDVVLSKIRPYLRKVALVNFEGTCSADMYPLRVTDRIDPHYLHIVLLAESFSRFAETVSARTGIPKINRIELAEYSAYFPPITEQKRIVDILGVIDDRICAELQSHRKLGKLKQALMDDLLTGRVRVPVGAGV